MLIRLCQVMYFLYLELVPDQSTWTLFTIQAPLIFPPDLDPHSFYSDETSPLSIPKTIYYFPTALGTIPTPCLCLVTQLTKPPYKFSPCRVVSVVLMLTTICSNTGNSKLLGSVLPRPLVYCFNLSCTARNTKMYYWTSTYPIGSPLCLTILPFPFNLVVRLTVNYRIALLVDSTTPIENIRHCPILDTMSPATTSFSIAQSSTNSFTLHLCV